MSSPTANRRQTLALVACFAGATSLMTACGKEGTSEPVVTQLPVTATSAAPTGPTQTLTAPPTDSGTAAPQPICDLLTQAEATEIVGEAVSANHADPTILGKVVHNSGQIIASCRYTANGVTLSYNVQDMKKPAAEHVAEQKKAVYKVQDPTGTSFAVDLADAAMGVYSTVGDKPLTRIDSAKGTRLYVVTVVGADQARQKELALKAATTIVGKI